MSIILPQDRDEWWVESAPQTCFSCSGVVPRDSTAVFWQGQLGILLHIQCAQSLGVALIQDAREATLAKGGEPHWTMRAARAAGHALRLSEPSE